MQWILGGLLITPDSEEIKAKAIVNSKVYSYEDIYKSLYVHKSSCVIINYSYTMFEGEEARLIAEDEKINVLFMTDMPEEIY